MNIFIEKDNNTIRHDKPCTVDELLTFLHINASSVIVVKNNEVVLQDEPLELDDDVKILSVISGG